MSDSFGEAKPWKVKPRVSIVDGGAHPRWAVSVDLGRRVFTTFLFGGEDASRWDRRSIDHGSRAVSLLDQGSSDKEVRQLVRVAFPGDPGGRRCISIRSSGRVRYLSLVDCCCVGWVSDRGLAGLSLGRRFAASASLIWRSVGDGGDVHGGAPPQIWIGDLLWILIWVKTWTWVWAWVWAWVEAPSSMWVWARVGVVAEVFGPELQSVSA